MNDDETAKHHQPRASSVSVAPSAHPASGVKIQQTKPPKQATKTGLLEDGALQRFTSGTWLLKPTSFSPTEDSFLAAMTGMGNALKVLPEPDLSGPKHVEIRKNCGWLSYTRSKLPGSWRVKCKCPRYDPPSKTGDPYGIMNHKEPGAS
ncbi:hypothetical protein PENPOL_c015G10590 [Penicillium polonicum]|uniref:Uncharacterized protein n=1 Tax=Penicillium polonicum TaxID=60169 RepID=A0A1V6NBJ4_PENPO|nr:hypothetical protein PENPOL_c015G10590 [Penicillium polonicum]